MISIRPCSPLELLTKLIKIKSTSNPQPFRRPSHRPLPPSPSPPAPPLTSSPKSITNRQDYMRKVFISHLHHHVIHLVNIHVGHLVGCLVSLHDHQLVPLDYKLPEIALYWHHQFQCLWIFWISSSEIHMNEFSNYHPTKFNCHLLFVEQITYCLLTKAIKVKKQYEILPVISS